MTVINPQYAKWFVYYGDDYWDNGGVGFETFETQDAARDARGRITKIAVVG